MHEIMEQSIFAYGEPASGGAVPLVNSFQTKQDYAYQCIKDHILYGHFKSGERLEIRDLAEKYGVSTTPIRAALIRLQADGLVTYTTHSGARVEKLKLHDVLDAHTAMGALQGLAAARAAQRHTPADIARLQAFLDEFERMPQSESPVFYNRLNFLFHRAIVEIGQYKILLPTMEGLFDVLRRAECVWIGVECYRDQSLQEHREIFQAIAGGNADQARACSERHYQRLRRDLESHVLQMENQ